MQKGPNAHTSLLVENAGKVRGFGTSRGLAYVPLSACGEIRVCMRRDQDRRMDGRTVACSGGARQLPDQSQIPPGVLTYIALTSLLADILDPCILIIYYRNKPFVLCFLKICVLVHVTSRL